MLVRVNFCTHTHTHTHTHTAEEGSDGEDLDSDVREQLTEAEGELRAYLLHGDPLSQETMEKYCTQFWNTEPYKLVQRISALFS